MNDDEVSVDNPTPANDNRSERMRFFEQSETSDPILPETPEDRARRDAEEKANFLLAEEDRLREMDVPEPHLTNTLGALGDRYQRWRDDKTSFIEALPDPDMQWQHKETVIKLGSMAASLHRDADKTVTEASKSSYDRVREDYLRQVREQQDLEMDDDLEPEPS